jgi:NADPH:quinone reductase-like Zn-dependent oxidoreductase
MSETMKAVRIHDFGEPDIQVYEDAPRPTISTDEVLVRVHAAGVNPVDSKTRAGRGMANRFSNPFPLIVGWDISGVVENVGANVKEFQPGDEVYAMTRFPEIGSAYAEYVSVPANQLALKPKNLDHIQAAAVPLVALTAWQILFDIAHLEAGQRILIHAAAGGVGHIAVQIAKWKGAYVIGTASARNADFLRELGADEVVDYHATPFEDVVQPVDVVLDCVGGLAERSLKVLKPGGFLSWITSGFAPERIAELGIRAGGTLVHTDQAQLKQITALIEAGNLKPVIDKVFPLAEAAKAHEAIDTGRTRGKIVLSVS